MAIGVIKTKSQKVLGANSYVCRSYRGKTGRVILNRVNGKLHFLCSVDLESDSILGPRTFPTKIYEWSLIISLGFPQVFGPGLWSCLGVQYVKVPMPAHGFKSSD